ncbi:MAG: hypothetical protein QOH09_4136 [Pseudonocardiales bacterium]|nr:hypothetical protein [Pseudonocardiales bacterium]
MRAVVVEVVFVFGQHCSCVALVDDEDPVEEFSADAADEPLSDRVGSWGSNWRLITSPPAAVKTASKLVVNLLSRSRMRSESASRRRRGSS